MWPREFLRPNHRHKTEELESTLRQDSVDRLILIIGMTRNAGTSGSSLTFDTRLMEGDPIGKRHGGHGYLPAMVVKDGYLTLQRYAETVDQPRTFVA